MFSNNQEDEDKYYRDEDYQRVRNGKKPMPVTPRMLVKSLKNLKKKTFKGLFFTPRDVAREILKEFPCVEEDYAILLLEVSDKLVCAAAAGLVGSKHDLGYYAFDMRQSGNRSHSRSELMFWVFYKRILHQKLEDERRKLRSEAGNSNSSKMKRKEKLPDSKSSKAKNSKKEKIYNILSLY